VSEKGIRQSTEQIEYNLNEESLELSNEERLFVIAEEKFNEWRSYYKYLPETESNEIEKIIEGLKVDIKSLTEEGEIITDEELEIFSNELNSLEEIFEKKLIENKDEILQIAEQKFLKEKNKFEETIKYSKKIIKENLLSSISSTVLNTEISKDLRVFDILSKEIDNNLINLGVEVNMIPNLIENAKTEKDPRILINNLENIESSLTNFNLSPNEYLKSLYNWNTSAEISSSIVSNLNEYIMAVDFFFSKKGIEEMLGINVPNTESYKETKKLIAERERQMLDRFSENFKFVKKYRKLPVHEITKLRKDYENEIICQFVADTLNKDSKVIKIQRKTHNYDKDSVLMLTMYEDRRSLSKYKELFEGKERSASTLYFEVQKDFYKEIFSHPELKDLVRINIRAEASGDKLQNSLDESFFLTAKNIKDLNYLDDPRLLNYKKQIDELAEIYELKGSKLIEAKAEFRKKYREDLIAPEGLGNLLYASRRLFRTFGNDPNFLMEMKELGYLNIDLINNDGRRKGKKYKEGRAYMMSERSYENYKKINADRMAFINGTTFESAKAPKMITYNSSSFGIEREDLKLAEDIKNDSLWENMKDLIETLKKRSTNIVNKIINMGSLFVGNINANEIPENLNAYDILKSIPNYKEINEIFIENIEIINKGKLSIEAQRILAEKKIEETALAGLVLRRNYEDPRLGEKYLEEAFHPDHQNLNNYLKNIYKAEKIPEDQRTANRETGLQIPTIKNPKAILYISKNINDIKTDSTVGILNLYLESDLKTDSSQDEKNLYKETYEALYLENLTSMDPKSSEFFLKYMISKECNNVFKLTNDDLNNLEYLKEKNDEQLNKIITKWLKEYATVSVSSIISEANVDITKQEERIKAIKILNILEKVNSLEGKLLRANIQKAINKELGLDEEEYLLPMMEIAEIAISKNNKSDSSEKNKAILAFKEGIYKGINPFENEMSNDEFMKKLNEEEQLIKNKNLT